ncbi:MAG: hypothetical protein ACLU6Y_06550 [Ruminococcus sp.]
MGEVEIQLCHRWTAPVAGKVLKLNEVGNGWKGTFHRTGYI